jgi:hypothetical protein
MESLEVHGISRIAHFQTFPPSRRAGGAAATLASMLTPGQFVGRVAEWVATFNRGSLDLPDGILHKDAVFRLNGRAYEDTLGRPATDPLVRLVARGPGGYRLLVKALQYTLTKPEIALRDFEVRGGLATGHVDLTGQLRDSGDGWESNADVAMTIDVDGRVTELAVQMDSDRVERLQRARQA